MASTIITPDDLKQFKEELLHDLITVLKQENVLQPRWLRSSQVRKLLHLSAGTLQNLRIKGTLPYTKVGGIIFYNYDAIQQLLHSHQQNDQFSRGHDNILSSRKIPHKHTD